MNLAVGQHAIYHFYYLAIFSLTASGDSPDVCMSRLCDPPHETCAQAEEATGTKCRIRYRPRIHVKAARLVRHSFSAAAGRSQPRAFFFPAGPVSARIRRGRRPAPQRSAGSDGTRAHAARKILIVFGVTLHTLAGTSSHCLSHGISWSPPPRSCFRSDDWVSQTGLDPPPPNPDPQRVFCSPSHGCVSSSHAASGGRSEGFLRRRRRGGLGD
jgi:hypothetical protein